MFEVREIKGELTGIGTKPEKINTHAIYQDGKIKFIGSKEICESAVKAGNEQEKGNV
jgi:hypothetical protein